MVNKELQILMSNVTTMIIVSNLHKMHQTLRDDDQWVRAHIVPLPPFIPRIVGKSFTT